MSHDERVRQRRGKIWLAAIAIAAGLAISGVSLIKLGANDPQLIAQGQAQGTQPSPTPPSASDKPAESKPGGTRPTTPAPEPARPDPDAQKAGAKPVLPAAPAEKVAPPIKNKE